MVIEGARHCIDAGTGCSDCRTSTGDRAEHASLFSLNGVSFRMVMAGVVAAFPLWAGFEACATLGKRHRNPKRNIPLATAGFHSANRCAVCGDDVCTNHGFGL